MQERKGVVNQLELRKKRADQVNSKLKGYFGVRRKKINKLVNDKEKLLNI